jgi:hypothetical protein
MPRDPLDELIEELEKALPPRPLGGPGPMPDVDQFSRLICMADSYSRERPRPSRVEARGAPQAAADVQDNSGKRTEH